jgi:hypothetical protein
MLAMPSKHTRRAVGAGACGVDKGGGTVGVDVGDEGGEVEDVKGKER